MSKPHAEIYAGLLTNLQPRDILFIDDKQENLDAAKLFDMDTILFTLSDYSAKIIHKKILNFLK